MLNISCVLIIFDTTVQGHADPECGVISRAAVKWCGYGKKIKMY